MQRIGVSGDFNNLNLLGAIGESAKVVHLQTVGEITFIRWVIKISVEGSDHQEKLTSTLSPSSALTEQSPLVMVVF